MAKRLEEWTDPLLGELVWDEKRSYWAGITEFAGGKVRLQLETESLDPSVGEQKAIIEAAHRLLAQLKVKEPEFRRRAAEEIAEAVASQESRVRLPRERFAETLQLETVSFHGTSEICGELHYHSPEFFPGSAVTIYFNPDLSFGDVEVYEIRR